MCQISGSADEFQVEADRSEPVVAGYHRRHGILHPPVEEVALTPREWLHERTYRIPCALAESLRTLPVVGYEFHPDLHVARVLDGILVQFHEVAVDGYALDCDPHVGHDRGRVWKDKLLTPGTNAFHVF